MEIREWPSWSAIVRALRPPPSSKVATVLQYELRAGGTGHDDALRRVAGRLAGILHGCLKHGRDYDETIARSHRPGHPQAA